RAAGDAETRWASAPPGRLIGGAFDQFALTARHSPTSPCKGEVGSRSEPGGGLKRCPPHPSPFQGEGGVCVTPQLNATARICCAPTRLPAAAAARRPSRSRA